MDASILIVLGLMGIVGEFFLPSGLSGIVGAGFLTAGVLLLLGVPIEFALVGGGVVSAMTALAVYIYSKYLFRTKPIKSGGESFIGLQAEVLKEFSKGKGQIRVRGEDWSATSKSGKNHKKGEHVKVVGFAGVFLEVE